MNRTEIKEKIELIIDNKIASIRATHIAAHSIYLQSMRDDLTDLFIELSNERNDWIDVKDQMPEENNEVIVCINGLSVGTAIVTLFNDPDRLVFVNENYDSFYSDDVTHWMPLPELH